MKIKLLVSRATANGAEDRGDVIEVSDAEAVRMIAAGQAEPIRSEARERAAPFVRAEKAVKG